MSKPIKMSNLLCDPTRTLHKLYKLIEFTQRIQELVDANLSEEFQGTCTVKKLHKGILYIALNNAAANSKFRFFVPQLQHRLARYPELASISKIKHNFVPIKTPHNHHDIDDDYTAAIRNDNPFLSEVKEKNLCAKLKDMIDEIGG